MLLADYLLLGSIQIRNTDHNTEAKYEATDYNGVDFPKQYVQCTQERENTNSL